MRNNEFEKWLSSYKQVETRLDVFDLKAAYEAGQAERVKRTKKEATWTKILSILRFG